MHDPNEHSLLSIHTVSHSPTQGIFYSVCVTVIPAVNPNYYNLRQTNKGRGDDELRDKLMTKFPSKHVFS